MGHCPTGQGGDKCRVSLDSGPPPCSPASLEGDGALSPGTARRKLLQHHFPYLFFLFAIIGGKYDMAEPTRAPRAHRAPGIFCWDRAGLAWQRGHRACPARARPAGEGAAPLGAVPSVPGYARERSGLGRAWEAEGRSRKMCHQAECM